MENKYLDYEGFEHTIERLRRKEMPTASVDYVGQIVQYVGSTNASYTKGYYYECVSDGETPATYSWVQRNIQPKENVRFNVLDYGLKGDKTTDNTEALRNLIATIPNGSVIFFPIGTYMISEGIEINKDVTFLGENQEMQSAGTASNRIHDPMSIIKYGGNTANVTMFTKASGYYDINFVNLTLDGGNSYDVTDNWTGTFTTLPFYNQLETTNLEGINGLDMSILSPGLVKNCMFWGFSGYGIKVAQHKYVERCGFLKCKKGIVTVFSDSLLHDLWFCKSGTAIYMLPKENDYFASVSLSDVWADQLIDHLVEADSSVTSAQIITDNVWVDSVGKSAFYLPEATISRARIQGTFGRIGMDYAGILDTDRTNALAQYTDFMACGHLTYSTLDLNISNVTIGKGSNANGECFSRLITTYRPGNANDHNKIICNSFPVSKFYDPSTQPQYASFSSSEYKGTDGDIVFYGNNNKFVNGFCTYNLSPVGRIKAIGKDFIVYDRVAKKLYRSTAADDNTAWVEIEVGKDVEIAFITPEDYGAVGDGVTDDSQAIDDALTAAIDKKIPIKFVHKIYLVNSFRFPNNVIMLGDNATLLGGPSLTNIENNNRHDIYVKGITFNFSKIIKLQGNASTQYANITFEDCVFKGAEQTALQFQWVSDITLRNCKFDDCGAELTDPDTYGRAVNIVGQANDSDTVFMKNIIIDGCEFSGTYGNKSVSIGNGWISGIDIRNCYFHDTTYGGIEFYNWRTKTNGYTNVVHDCVFERMGAAPMAAGDPRSGTSSSGVGCCALYLKNSSSAIIATRNVFKYCVENAIEGTWQEISYNIIDTTGVMQDTRPTPSIEGIYLNGTQQSVHHNDIKRTGRTAIIATNQSAPGITDLKIFSNVIKDSNQYEGWTGTDDIRCTMFASGLTLRDNSYDNNFFLNLDSSNGPMEKFYWNQPRLFVSSRALHFKNGFVDIDGEKSRKDGWELSDAVTQDDEGHYLLPQNSQMTYKFEFNRFDGVRAHLIAKVKYSMQDIVGTDNVLRISINTDTSHPNSSVLYIKGKYASADSEASPMPDEIVYNAINNPSGDPSAQGWYENTGTSQTPVYTLTSDTTVDSSKTYYQKKEYYTDYAILNTDNTSSKILTAQIKNVSANTGNLEIVEVDFKVPYGIAINSTSGSNMYKVYSGTYDSVEGEFYDTDGNALPKIDQQQYYDITTRTTWIYYSTWSSFFRLFNDVVGMESSQMLSPLITQYYPELNTAHFRCMNVSGNDGGLIEGFIYKLDRVSVTPETGDSPADEGWWEVDSTTGKMIQTTDTEVVSGKLYFDYVWTQVKTQQSVFPGTLDEWDALTEAEKAKYDFVATPEEADTAAFTKYFVISNSDVNVGEPFYTNKTNSFEVFKIVADTIFNDVDVSGKLTPYVGHATAYTTDDSGYPNFGVTTWVASACMGANGHPYIRIRIFTDDGREYRFQRSQDGTYTLAEVPAVKTISNPFAVNTGKATSAYEEEALKQGRVVQFKVYIESFKNIASETWNTLGTVVDAIKPAMETPLSMSDGRVISATALSRITPNGELQIWGTDALNTLSSRFSATYFSAD